MQKDSEEHLWSLLDTHYHSVYYLYILAVFDQNWEYMEASNTDTVRQVLPRRLCLHLLKWSLTAAELGPIEIKAFPSS